MDMRGKPAMESRARYQRSGARRNHNGICPASGKRIYRTRKKAIKAPAPVGQPHQVYECRACGFWHTSTQEQR